MTPTDIRDTAIPEDVMETSDLVVACVNVDAPDRAHQVLHVARAIMAAKEAERERCAKIAEDRYLETDWQEPGQRIAAAIRAGTKGARHD